MAKKTTAIVRVTVKMTGDRPSKPEIKAAVQETLNLMKGAAVSDDCNVEEAKASTVDIQ